MSYLGMGNSTEWTGNKKANQRFFIHKLESTENFHISPEMIQENKLKENSNPTSLEFVSEQEKIEESWSGHINKEESQNPSEYSRSVEMNQYNTGRWTEKEHKKFIEAILLYGNEWKRVQQYISTRSSTQARSHAQKFFLRLKKSINLSGQFEEEHFNFFKALSDNRKSKQF